MPALSSKDHTKYRTEAQKRPIQRGLHIYIHMHICKYQSFFPTDMWMLHKASRGFTCLYTEEVFEKLHRGLAKSHTEGLQEVPNHYTEGAL